MEVFCDQSDPLKVNQEVFNQMIGRREKFYNTLGDVPFLLTFNLSSPIKFIDSSSCEGIQIADIVASVLSYAMCNQADSTAKEWLNILSSKLDNPSLLPDRGDINLENEKAFVNSLILEELVERSVNGDDIFTAMPEFIQAAKNAYSKYVISR